MPKFSIITINYNEPKLEDTCKTIVNQTFQDFEWIVIDGGSNKETLDILDKYKSRINYFVSEKDNGRYHAMNKGIKQAHGDYLIFMNAGDCFYNNNILQDVRNLMENNQNKADVYYGNGYLRYPGNKLELFKKPKQLNFDFVCLFPLFHQAMFFKRELFSKFGCYDEKYKIVSDWKYYLNLYKNNCSFEYIDVNVAVDDANGISNVDVNLSHKEEQMFFSELFDEKELKEINEKKLKWQQNTYNKIREAKKLIKEKINLLKNKK